MSRGRKKSDVVPSQDLIDEIVACLKEKGECRVYNLGVFKVHDTRYKTPSGEGKTKRLHFSVSLSISNRI